MKKNTFYVTTPIYYPNDVPHLGHAYTTIAADVLARWHKLLGKEVFFLTGTDEHGKKVEEAAQKKDLAPKKFVDTLVPEFKNAWKKLNIEYDRFIRTTDKDHEKFVKEVLQKSYDNGDIYLDKYEGLYCTACEAYYTETNSKEGCCPVHKKPLEKLSEESYFFKLSKYKDFLLDLYKKNPEFISPKNRKKEIINRVKEELRDFSVSRTSLKWGIPLPFDKKHVCYVWFDALFNYITPTLETKNKKFWPADVQLIGKDIIWFHTVYWPAMLKSAGFELPKKVFAHGWWTVLNEKMGKSAGNAIKVDQLISYAGVDSARYFLLREASFGDDGDFSEKSIIDRHNNELANKLGNLVSRTSTLAEKYGIDSKSETSILSKELVKQFKEHMEKVELDKAIHLLIKLTDQTNEYFQNKKPWETQDKKVLYQVAEAIKTIAILFSPVIPETSEKIAKTFNFKLTLKDLESPLKVSKIKKADILFKKIDSSPDKDTSPENNSKPKTKESSKTDKNSSSMEIKMKDGKIPIDEFAKLDLQVGLIKSVEDHPDADKLYILKVDLGEKQDRQIIAGLKPYYKQSELKNQQAIFITNLEPAKIRGQESNGMILASDDGKGNVVFTKPEKEAKVGAKLK